MGLIYIVALSRWLLPDRRAALSDMENARDYSAAFRVSPDAPIIGSTIEGAGLRHLPGLYLVEIEREGETLPAVAPDTKLKAGDVLIFVGVLESVVDLRKIRGLVPAADDQVKKLGGPSSGRRLVEAVVAHGSPLAGKTVRDAAFRTHYRAAIIAVHRNGARLRGKIGDIELRFGDTLLLETQPTFLDAYRNDRSFALVSQVNRSTPVRHERGGIAVLLLLTMIARERLWVDEPVYRRPGVRGRDAGAHCLTGSEARRALELNVLLAIAASFSVGKALEITGAAQFLGENLVHVTAPLGKLGAMAGVYLAVMVLTELVTNNAAAALLLPVAIAAGETAGIPLKPMCYVVMFAASASFMTPIGYQTNLMVYGPGRLSFRGFHPLRRSVADPSRDRHGAGHVHPLRILTSEPRRPVARRTAEPRHDQPIPGDVPHGGENVLEARDRRRLGDPGRRTSNDRSLHRPDAERLEGLGDARGARAALRGHAIDLTRTSRRKTGTCS